MVENIEPILGWKDKIIEKYPIFSFSLLEAKHKNYNKGLFVMMFLPTIQIIIMLNLTSNDYSGGLYWTWFYQIYFNILLFFLVSVLSLIVATGIFRDQINDETIVFLVSKPIDRRKIYLEKYFAYIVISFIIVTPGVILYHITGDISARLFDTKFELSILSSLYNLFLELIGAYLLLIGLGTIFITTGLWLRRPMLVNLLIAFGIILEQFFLDLISNRFEPVYIAQNFVAKELSGFTPELFAEFRRYSLAYYGFNVEALTGVLYLLIIVGITLFLGLRLSSRKEFP
jgi:ABC-type transport system involved in multi-copper enzyme maturation permease subunit